MVTTAVIRPASVDDSACIARIYNHYIRESIITFEEEEVTATEVERRIGEVLSAGLPWLTAVVDDAVAGYAYATRWKRRSAYRFSAEVTIYLDHTHAGAGLGSRLYEELFSIIRQQGFRAVMAGIALPNEPSIALHEKFGMSKVAHFKEVGFKFDTWIDVGYWQRLL